MKNFSFLFCALVAASISFGQTIPNGGMETWRNSTAGTTSIPVHAPTSWFGLDSLIIGFGETFLGVNPSHPWNAQIFQESTIVYSSSYSAKIMTLSQDTLGFVPGALSNAQASLNVIAILGGASPLTAISYSGGTPVTMRINTVSAWVEYLPGIDTSTGMMGGNDTALLTVEALGTVGANADSVLGTGVVAIPSTPSFTQITANLVYTDTIDEVNNMRFFFTSSGGATQILDSSTLYVDSVTMTGTPEVSHVGVKNVTGNEVVTVYPNPAADVIYIDGPQNAGLSCYLSSVSGQLVASKTLTGNDALDVSYLPAGMYLYTISDHSGNVIQKGKVTVAR